MEKNLNFQLDVPRTNAYEWIEPKKQKKNSRKVENEIEKN